MTRRLLCSQSQPGKGRNGGTGWAGRAQPREAAALGAAPAKVPEGTREVLVRPAERARLPSPRSLLLPGEGEAGVTEAAELLLGEAKLKKEGTWEGGAKSSERCL